jgi:hypothetical protein
VKDAHVPPDEDRGVAAVAIVLALAVVDHLAVDLPLGDLTTRAHLEPVVVRLCAVWRAKMFALFSPSRMRSSEAGVVPVVGWAFLMTVVVVSPQPAISNASKRHPAIATVLTVKRPELSIVPVLQSRSATAPELRSS